MINKSASELTFSHLLYKADTLDRVASYRSVAATFIRDKYRQSLNEHLNNCANLFGACATCTEWFGLIENGPLGRRFIVPSGRACEFCEERGGAK